MKNIYVLRPMRFLLLIIVAFLISPVHSFSASNDVDCSGSGSINDPHIPDAPGP